MCSFWLLTVWESPKIPHLGLVVGHLSTAYMRICLLKVWWQNPNHLTRDLYDILLSLISSFPVCSLNWSNWMRNEPIRNIHISTISPFIGGGSYKKKNLPSPHPFVRDASGRPWFWAARVADDFGQHVYITCRWSSGTISFFMSTVMWCYKWVWYRVRHFFFKWSVGGTKLK